MEPDELNEDPAPDFGPEEPWASNEVMSAVNTLVDALYSAGCSVNGIVITIPNIPGDELTIHSDYGDVLLVQKDVEL